MYKQFKNQAQHILSALFLPQEFDIYVFYFLFSGTSIAKHI